MPTVPFNPGPDDGTAGIPTELQPTPGDLLMAAAIMQQRGGFAEAEEAPAQAAALVLTEPREDTEAVSPLVFGPEMLQRSTEQEQRRIQPTPLGIVPQERR